MSHRRHHKFIKAPEEEWRTKCALRNCFGDGCPQARLAKRPEGYKAERRFEEAWRAKPIWLKSVRRGNAFEDRHQHTDFVLTLNFQDTEIKVDVKASTHAKEKCQDKFEEKHPDAVNDVIFVVADFHSSFERIRQDTITAIADFLRRTNPQASRWFESQKRRH